MPLSVNDLTQKQLLLSGKSTSKTKHCLCTFDRWPTRPPFTSPRGFLNAPSVGYIYHFCYVHAATSSLHITWARFKKTYSQGSSLNWAFVSASPPQLLHLWTAEIYKETSGGSQLCKSGGREREKSVCMELHWRANSFTLSHAGGLNKSEERAKGEVFHM